MRERERERERGGEREREGQREGERERKRERRGERCKYKSGVMLQYKRMSARKTIITSLVMIRYREISNFEFAKIFRIFISGSSSAGKTYFARTLLQQNLFQFNRVYYYHPDFHEHAPVSWHEELDKPVLYQAGVPSLKDLLEIPEYSCLVFDDLFSQCCESKDIDYLFRVLSSKRKLNVIIMTQRYFAEGKCGLSIRNSSNYHVLMRNADARTNLTVANSMQLKPEITKAIEVNKEKLYPYIFIDRTNQARVNNLQIFTDIFTKHLEVIIGRMKYYLISEADFVSSYKITGSNIADANTAPQLQSKSPAHSTDESSSESSQSSQSTDSSDSSKEIPTNKSINKTARKSGRVTKFKQRKRREQEIARVIRRHYKNSKLLSQD